MLSEFYILGREKFNQKKLGLQVKDWLKTPWRYMLSFVIPFYDPASTSRTTITYLRTSYFRVNLENSEYHVEAVASVEDLAMYYSLKRQSNRGL